MSTERKNPFKRDQALNDATSGRLGDDLSDDPYQEKYQRREPARRRSKQI